MKKLKIDLLMFAGGRGQNLAYLKIGSDLLTNTKGDVAISISAGEIETTDDSSGGFKEFIEGDREVTIAGSFNYQQSVSTSAPAQATLIDNATAGGDIEIEWAYETGAGKDNYSGTAILTAFGSTNADPQVQTFTLRLKGVWTEGTQS